ncbi:MAG: circadian clock protein KaiA [Spirulinaceae cyanobacterium]
MADLEIPINSNTDNPILSKLSICALTKKKELVCSLEKYLQDEYYNLNILGSSQDFFKFVEPNQEQIDCLVLHQAPPLFLLEVTRRLCELGIFLPAVIIKPNDLSEQHQSHNLSQKAADSYPCYIIDYYHRAEVQLPFKKGDKIVTTIEQALTRFIKLTPNKALPTQSIPWKNIPSKTSRKSLKVQQQRLAEKLKERLGYLGVYYKRNPQDFFCNILPNQQDDLLKSFYSEYRQIILSYFSSDAQLNKLIDKFVNKVFFADLSVAKIVEIHMEIMDEFSQQLKLEGRSEDILLDYRLTLIDIIAHLGEMYRRSIPRENTSLEPLSSTD